MADAKLIQIEMRLGHLIEEEKKFIKLPLLVHLMLKAA